MTRSQEKQSPGKQASPAADERAKRIQELKKAVADGTYRVKSRDLACDLLGALVDS